MPVMDGLEASRRILSLKTGVPIVAMTANVMSDDKRFYVENGMNDCMGKPFTSQELWQCLLRYFKPLGWHSEDTDAREQADSELRQKLINNFVRSNYNKYTEITDALADNNVKLAHRLTHTLKNNAAQLKLTKLHAVSESVERRLKDGTNAADPKDMQTMKTELDAALAELSLLVAEKRQTADESELMPPADAFVLLNRIKPLIEGNNTECMSYTDSLRLVAGGAELIQAIENIDFAAALECLNKLLTEIKNDNKE
jgi:CheY-like chemotaxis protein